MNDRGLNNFFRSSLNNTERLSVQKLTSSTKLNSKKDADNDFYHTSLRRKYSSGRPKYSEGRGATTRTLDMISQTNHLLKSNLFMGRTSLTKAKHKSILGESVLNRDSSHSKLSRETSPNKEKLDGLFMKSLQTYSSSASKFAPNTLLGQKMKSLRVEIKEDMGKKHRPGLK